MFSCLSCPTAFATSASTVVPLAEEDIFTKCRTESVSPSSTGGAECRLNILHLSALECQNQLRKQTAKTVARSMHSLDILGRGAGHLNGSVRMEKWRSSRKYKDVGQKITVTAEVQRSNEIDTCSPTRLPPVNLVDPVNQSGYKLRLIDRLASSRYSKLVPRRLIEKSVVINNDDPSSSLSDQRKNKRSDRFHAFFGRANDSLEISSAFTNDSLTIHQNVSDFAETITKGCLASDERFHAASYENDVDVPVEKSTVHGVMFFIHGVGGCMKIWEHQIKHFHSKGYEIIAMDLIGHGGSTLPNSKSRYEFRAIKTDVMLVFDKYSSKLPYTNIIMAHSYGTCFAALLSRERPNLIGHLILISCGAPVPLVPDGGVFRLPTTLFRLIRPILNYNFSRLAYHIKPSPENFRRAFGMVDSKAFRFVMLGQNWPQGDRIYHQLIGAPTLLIYGLSDRLVTLEEMNEMRKTIPDAHLEVIEQSSHMVMQENAGQVNELIDKFLSTVEPGQNCVSNTSTYVPVVKRSVDDNCRPPKIFRTRHSTSNILSRKSIARNKRPKSSGSRLTTCMPILKVF